MTFPAVVFDEMIHELGELVQLRDQALSRPEIAGAPPVEAAMRGLKQAVSAVGRVAERGARESDVQAARRALADAQRLFLPVKTLLGGTSRVANDCVSPSSPSTRPLPS